MLRQTNSVMYGSDALTRRGEHQHEARHVARADARLHDRRRQSRHVQQRALVRRCLQAFRLLLAVPRTTRRTTTCPTTVTETALTQAVSVSRLVPGRTCMEPFAISTAVSATRMASICIASPTTRCPTPIRRTSAWLPIRRSTRAGRRPCDSARRTRSRCHSNPTPSGIPFDPFGFGANYLGETVTLTDAEGRTVTGQGILDYGGVYPVRSRRARRANRCLARQRSSGRATWQFQRAAASSTRPATAIPMPTRRTPATMAARSSRDAQLW